MSTWSPSQVVTDEYGVQESNGIDERVEASRDSLDGAVSLNDKGLEAITRLRLVSDPGFPLWDVSYCYGRMKDGRNVRVHLPVTQFSKRRLKGELIEMARREGVYAKGLGLLGADVISTLQ